MIKGKSMEKLFPLNILVELRRIELLTS